MTREILSQPDDTPEAKEARRKALLADADRWSREQAEKAKLASATAATFDQVKSKLVQSFATLPEKVEIPYEHTPEGERWTKFKRVCDPKFLPKIDYALVKNRTAFDEVINWDGRAPGPCATGATDLGKTRAAWWALRRCYVRDNQPFAWFPVRRLVTELETYEKKDCADEFFRTYDFFKMLFVDDADKINWDFESHAQMLFAFFDWVYRKQKPCIVTTNKDRKWWANKMGDAFARRMFDDACREVKF